MSKAVSISAIFPRYGIGILSLWFERVNCHRVSHKPLLTPHTCWFFHSHSSTDSTSPEPVICFLVATLSCLLLPCPLRLRLWLIVVPSLPPLRILHHAVLVRCLCPKPPLFINHRCHQLSTIRSYQLLISRNARQLALDLPSPAGCTKDEKLPQTSLQTLNRHSQVLVDLDLLSDADQHVSSKIAYYSRPIIVPHPLLTLVSAHPSGHLRRRT